MILSQPDLRYQSADAQRRERRLQVAPLGKGSPRPQFTAQKGFERYGPQRHRLLAQHGRQEHWRPFRFVSTILVRFPVIKRRKK